MVHNKFKISHITEILLNTSLVANKQFVINLPFLE